MPPTRPYVTHVRGEYDTSTSTVTMPWMAGDVLPMGMCNAITVRDLEFGEVSSLCTRGGVWEGFADQAIAAGVDVYFNHTTNYVTETATANSYLGRSLSAAGATDEKIKFYYDPCLPLVGGPPPGPVIPPGALEIQPALDWVPVYWINISELTNPNVWCTNDSLGMFEYWYWTVPATGTYTVDVTDRFQPGDRFELWADTGSGETLLATSNTVPDKCSTTLDESDYDTCWASGNWSSIAGIPLTNSTTYVFRIKLIESSENHITACTPFDSGVGGIRTKS